MNWIIKLRSRFSNGAIAFELALQPKLCKAVTENYFNWVSGEFSHHLMVAIRIAAFSKLRQNNPLARRDFFENNPIKKLLSISHR
ncbi:hypothetical protein [Nostoc sp. DSM 114160]